MLFFNHKTDRRTELLELAADENITLPLSVELILWLEDKGWLVDLLTGQTSRVDGETLAIRWLTDAEIEVEADDYEDAMEDEEFIRRGC